MKFSKGNIVRVNKGILEGNFGRILHPKTYGGCQIIPLNDRGERSGSAYLISEDLLDFHTGKGKEIGTEKLVGIKNGKYKFMMGIVKERTPIFSDIIYKVELLMVDGCPSGKYIQMKSLNLEPVE